MNNTEKVDTELFEGYLEPREDSLETLVELIIEEDIDREEDQNILRNESREKIRESVRTWAETLEDEGLDMLTEHRRNRGIFASSITQKMQAHDEEKPIEAYTYGAVDRIFFYPNAGIEDSIEAGFAYVDALFEKDKVEDKYRDEDGVLDTEKMREADNWNHEAIEIDYGQMKADFTLSDLGEWSEVYKAFNREADQVVKPFFKNETKYDGEEVAKLTALNETRFWRNHKIGEEPENSKEENNYTKYLIKAIQKKFAAATGKTEQIDPKPKAAHFYSMAVENHDVRNWEWCIQNMRGYHKMLERPAGKISVRNSTEDYKEITDIISRETGLKFS